MPVSLKLRSPAAHASSLKGGLLLLTLAASACGQMDDAQQPQPQSQEPPTLTSTLPSDTSIDVPVDAAVFAVFDLAMSPLDEVTFTLTQDGAQVDGTVGNSDDGTTAAFVPTELLAGDTVFTAHLTTDATSQTGVAFLADHSWTFTTAADEVDAPFAPDPSLVDGDDEATYDDEGIVTFARKPRPPKAVRVGPAPVILGTAASYAALAKTGISTVPSSSVTGNIAVSPAAATYITGFSLILDATNRFSRSTQVIGKVYAADYATPTPTTLTTAVSDMETAYTDAAGRSTPDFSELGTGAIGGMTLTPGLYNWTSSVGMVTDVTLSGGASDTWIFQTSGDLTMAPGVRIILAGGAQASNIFWQVAGNAAFGTTSHFEGNLMCKTDVTLQTGASMNGRILSQTAVTLQQATLVKPN